MDSKKFQFMASVALAAGAVLVAQGSAIAVTPGRIAVQPRGGALPVSQPAPFAVSLGHSSGAPECKAPSGHGAGDVTVRGSSTWEPINDRIATRFEYATAKLKLNNRVEYPPGGSTFGIRQLIEGNCVLRGITAASCDLNGDGVLVDPLLDGSGPGFVPDIAQSSREANAAEKAAASANGLPLRGAAVGIDGLGIVVNASNPITAHMTGQNVTDIYMLGNKVWEDFGVTIPACVDGTGFSRIHVVSRTTEGGTFGSFSDLYIDPWFPGNSAAAQTALAARLDLNGGPIRSVSTALDGEAAVAADVCGIFYAGVGDIAQNAGVKAIKTTKGVLPGQFPNFTTISNGSFEFQRKLWLYWVGDQPRCSKIAQYVDFAQASAGQAVMFEAGFVPAIPLFDTPAQAAYTLGQYPAANPQDARY